MEKRFRKSDRMVQREKWALIWYQQLAKFHGRHRPGRQGQGQGQDQQGQGRQEQRVWQFTADHVIAFLRSKRDAGVPGWKRMKIIEGLIDHRRKVQKIGYRDLLPLRDKMIEIIAIERARDRGIPTIEDVVGKIDPRESDVIQEFRRAVRRHGLALRTERSYVGKIRAFMRDRGLKCLADFQAITASDIEAHLSDLAVDGNVAPSTQNAAFYALLKLFELVLKRELGEINAIRACKAKPIPTVLSGPEVTRVTYQVDRFAVAG